MNKVKIIQKILDATKRRVYLEIGVQHGSTFLPIKARRKIGIDPDFKINPWKKFLYPAGFFRNEYFAMTSDEFFLKGPEIFKRDKIDVAFIDGLHTYNQSFKDFENCLEYLAERGFIVFHDCLAPAEKYIASCGDVWKSIARLRATREDLAVFVLNCDTGLGIVTRGQAESKLGLSVEEIERLTHGEFLKEKDDILNLKPVEYLDKFLTARKKTR